MRGEENKEGRSTQHLECPGLRAGFGSYLPQGLTPRGQGSGFTVLWLVLFMINFQYEKR